jgi:tellurite resistance protein
VAVVRLRDDRLARHRVDHPGPAFLRLRFSGAFWAFAFSWTAVATVGLHWIRESRPAGGDVGTALVLAAATLLVGAIAVRTVVALYRGELFPRDAVPDPPSFAAWRRAA